jgi:hypothetical protein
VLRKAIRQLLALVRKWWREYDADVSKQSSTRRATMRFLCIVCVGVPVTVSLMWLFHYPHAHLLGRLPSGAAWLRYILPLNAILSVTGGIGAAQLLDVLDYQSIASTPKIVCGYSDVTILWNAIGRCSEVATYYGPNFNSFMIRKRSDYTLEVFRNCLFADDGFELKPSETWSDDAWANGQEDREFLANDGFWAIQEGHAVGRIVGGTHFGLNLLQGGPYFPCLEDAVLFIEMPASGKATLMDLDSALPSPAGIRFILQPIHGY